MTETIQTIPVHGFDPGGEPQIEVLGDGCLMVSFAFMPPSWVSDPEERMNLGPFHDFDRQLSRAIGIPVEWEDREVFVICTPEPDTIDRIKAFLVNHPFARSE